jgi:uncharacterized protein (TIGR02271 family)
MNQLVRLRDIQTNYQSELGQDYYDPQGRTVYGANNEKIGKIEGALVEEGTGKIRYFIVDVGGWFNSKQVLIPAGFADFRGDDDVYIGNLTRDYAENLDAYDENRGYTYDDVKAQDQRVFSNEFANTNIDNHNKYYDSPTKLELLEERLTVGKDRYVAGTLAVGKRVVSNEQSVDVTLEEEEALINRHPVDNRPTDREIGADSQTISLELEAERANINKKAYVVEEVEIAKTSRQHQETVTDTVRHEELDVQKTGNVHQVDNDKTPR